MGRTSTTEEFITKAKEIHGDKYDYSTVKYVSTNEKVSILCPIHGSFLQTPKIHLKGLGCPKCENRNKKKKNVTDTASFIIQANKTHDNRYDYSKTEYHSAKTKVEIICPEHGSFFQTPDAHIHGRQGCPVCGKESYTNSLNMTWKDFLQTNKKVHKNRYIYHKEDFVNGTTKTRITCRIHGDFYQTPCEHHTGRGCAKCGRTATAKKLWTTREKFIERANKIHNNKYSYEKVKYVNAMTKVTITCPVHGDFNQEPNTHIVAQCGCPLCFGERLSTMFRMGKEEFISRANKEHKNKYTYDKVDYINAQTLVIITCPKHGDFKQIPASHLTGCGCPKCNSSKMEKKTREFLSSKKINFVEQKKFDSCKSKHCLPFDFYIPEYNTAIECQGEQHYNSIALFGGEKNLKEIQKRDKIKKNFCLANHIKLIEIPYWEAKNIPAILTANLPAHA